MAGVLSHINKLAEQGGWRWREKLGDWGSWGGLNAGRCAEAEAAETSHVTFAVAGGGEAEGDRTVQKYLNIDYS